MKDALERSEQKDVALSLVGANRFKKSFPSPGETKKDRIDLSTLDLQADEITMPEYRKYNDRVNSQYEPHDRPIPEVVDIVVKIVKVEGLIHTDEVARRYASAHDKSRVGNRIQETVLRGLMRAKKQGLILETDDFWGTEDQFKNPPIRNRQNESPPLTKPQYLSADEILACSKLIEEESGEVDIEEMIRAVSRVLGFKRAGPDFQSRVRKVITEHS